MSDTRVEITGNIVVHHPVKEAEVIQFPKPERPLETGLAA